MESVYQLLAIVAAGLLVWILYRQVKARPEQFSREKMSKSFFSMGVLALFLIGFIALLILFLR